MSEEQILQAFKNNTVSFLDELIDQFPSETGLILARVFLKDQIPARTAMSNFLVTIERGGGIVKTLVKDRDENFFLENNIFSCPGGSLGTESVNHMRKIWMGGLDDEDKLTMWKWIDSFIHLATKYQEVLKHKHC
jgi:hypothetical protein|tara:strand:- start:24 stop:428 length:405 start_codon:yes stop_codon:yes gene_type:complete